MNSSASPNLDDFMESAVTSSANGSRASDSAPTLAHRQFKPSTNKSLPNGQVHSLGHSFMSGPEQGQHPCSMRCSIPGLFLIRNNGSIGQEILDANGKTIAWTTDEIVAQVICRMLNAYSKEGLLR